MDAMIYDDDKQFALRTAAEDDVKLVTARLLADTSFEMWDPQCSEAEYNQWLHDHSAEILDAPMDRPDMGTKYIGI